MLPVISFEAGRTGGGVRRTDRGAERASEVTSGVFGVAFGAGRGVIATGGVLTKRHDK